MPPSGVAAGALRPPRYRWRMINVHQAQAEIAFSALPPCWPPGLGLADRRSGGRSIGVDANRTFPVTVHAANGTVRIAAVRRPSCRCRRRRPRCSTPSAPAARSRRSTSSRTTRRARRRRSSTATIPTWRPSRRTSRTSWCCPTRPRASTSSSSALGIPVLSDPAATNLSQEYAQFDELGKATGHVAQARGRGGQDQGPDRAHRRVGATSRPTRRPTTTSSTRPTTRRRRARSSGRCWACSACTASPTRPRVPRPAAATRS